MIKKIREWLKKHSFVVWGIGSIFFALVIHVLFKTSGSDFWKPAWDAGDILSYTSTVALGLLAVWQNTEYQKANDKIQQEMQRIEKNEFISDNSCMAIISGIKFDRMRNTATNFDLHTEQILETPDILKTTKQLSMRDYNSLSIVIELKNIKGCPALFKVDDVLLSVLSGNKEHTEIHAKADKDYYSRIAMGIDNDLTSITIVLTNEEYSALLQILQQNECEAMISIDYHLASANGVDTKLRCNATYKDFSRVSYDTIRISAHNNGDISCFWYGHTIIDSIQEKVKEERYNGTPNP